MYKGILLLLLIIGLLMVVIEVVKENQTAPTEKIIYRYIPRTFAEEQDEPIFVSDIFKSMFNDSSPWVNGMNDLDTRNKEKINKYFISQM
jgi:hypothetical protein